MRRHTRSVLALVAYGLVLSLGGCGGDSNTVTQSPEAKKADMGGQDAMRDFMKSQAKGKSTKKAGR